MAGFLDSKNKGLFSNLSRSLQKIGSMGMEYGDMVVKNSQALGTTEAEYLRRGTVYDENTFYTLRKTDTATRQYIPYYERDYKARRDFLRAFAQNPEIEFIIEQVCDEAVVYDEKNFFAYFKNINITGIKGEVESKVTERFKQIYNLFGFNENTNAWHYFRKFIIDGAIAFEIVYDDDNKNIIGYKELDAASIVPTVEKNADGTLSDVWVLYPENPALTCRLYDSQIIYISYSRGGSSRISYVERLVRSFNLLRIMEHTRIIWNVMNSSYRMTMTVPIGTKSPQKAKQSLGELMSIYKEDIKLDSDSGELHVNGKPNLQFFKNYMMPSSVNGTPDVAPLAGSGDGTMFTDIKPLAYFVDKLRMDSRLPNTRFGRDESGNMAQHHQGAEGLDQDEIRFGKFINRLRSIFQDILLKPLWIQFCLDFPDHKEDLLIKSQFTLDYVKENEFIRAKYLEVMTVRKEQVNKMLGLKTGDGKSYFSTKYVIDKYLGMTEADRAANEAERKKKKKLNKENKDQADNGTGADGDTAAFDTADTADSTTTTAENIPPADTGGEDAAFTL